LVANLPEISVFRGRIKRVDVRNGLARAGI
jgi:hypothetical protein